MAGSFQVDISNFINKANKSMDKAVTYTLLGLGRMVVENSPVGDASYWQHPPPPGYVGGRFRANWQHGTGTMPTIVYDMTANIGFQRIQSSIPNNSAGLVHWIINNVPYSIRLENGYSRQAPQGIVGRALLSFPGIVARAARDAHT